ncbi:hypothetical protein [Psychrobacter ciconiae]|uniref:hypothetical protein n=1 Tax=Psychrobacter ciconiae TaxID=1553449 RepID=UPI00191A5672|nr:hypothetical protein [Psychrobacter ciconiae]
MKNNYLSVFSELQNQLLNFPRNTLYDNGLRVIVEAQLNKLNYLEDTFEPEKLSRQTIYAKAKKIDESTVSSQTAKDSLKTARLKSQLDDFIDSQPDCKQAFVDLGYLPQVVSSESEGGAKNTVLFWMDIIPIEVAQPDDEVMDDPTLTLDLADPELQENYDSITYFRAPAAQVKSSLLTKTFFKNGELRIKSIRGGLLMVVLLLCFAAEIFIAIFSLLVLLLLEHLKTFSLWQAMLFVLFIPLPYISLRYFFMPLYSLPYQRVIKAPMFFSNVNSLNADIEMYRGQDGFNIARMTEFTAQCPICSGNIILAKGMPDQRQPLVGRCVEAPHAHVYSFDRMTMKGSFLGVSDYLADKKNEN